MLLGEKPILENMCREQGGAAAAEAQVLYILGKHFIVEPQPLNGGF